MHINIMYEVNPWSNAPMAGAHGILMRYYEGSDRPVVLRFGGMSHPIAYRKDEVTMLHNKPYPY